METKMGEGTIGSGLLPRVLVVDDSEPCRRVAAGHLELSGSIVTTASNGFDAISLLETLQFDLVLMDLALPDADGCEVTRRFRSYELSLGSHTPIIAVTAHVYPVDVERCQACGMDGFLAKPYTQNDLYRVVRMVGTALRAGARAGREAAFVSLTSNPIRGRIAGS